MKRSGINTWDVTTIVVRSSGLLILSAVTAKGANGVQWQRATSQLYKNLFVYQAYKVLSLLLRVASGCHCDTAEICSHVRRLSMRKLRPDCDQSWCH